MAWTDPVLATARVSVVIPVFGDANALPECFDRLFRMADSHGYDLEVVVVDDGSGDCTWKRIVAAAECHGGRNVLLVRLRHNQGQALATLCGLTYCRSARVVTLDGDLQHPPEAIPDLIAALDGSGLELVYGAGSEGHGWLRRTLSVSYRALASLAGAAYFHASSFRVMTSDVAARLTRMEAGPVLAIDDCLRQLVTRVGHVRFGHQRRRHGKSSYTWKRLLTTVAFAPYHSPQLVPIARRLLLASTVLWAGSTAAGFAVFLPGIASAQLVFFVALLLACQVVAARRRLVPLAEQCAVGDIIDRRQPL